MHAHEQWKTDLLYRAREWENTPRVHYEERVRRAIPHTLQARGWLPLDWLLLVLACAVVVVLACMEVSGR